MRLINIHNLEMKEFLLETAPPYVTLSHRWSDDEISYEDFISEPNKSSTGYKKIEGLCHFVRRVGVRLFLEFSVRKDSGKVEWVWVDSCCRCVPRNSLETRLTFPDPFRHR